MYDSRSDFVHDTSGRSSRSGRRASRSSRSSRRMMPSFVDEASPPPMTLDTNRAANDEQDGSAKYDGLWNVLHLGVGFLLLFGAYNTLQNLVTTLLPGCLGFWSLCILYVSVCPSLFVAPAVCASLGNVKTMAFGAMCYTVWMGSLTLLDVPNLSSEIATIIVIVTSIVIGFGASILWVAQGAYLTECGNESNRGLLSAAFWGVFQISGVLGNSLGYAVLEKGSSGDDAELLSISPSSSPGDSPSGSAALFIGAAGLGLAATLTLMCLRRPADGGKAGTSDRRSERDSSAPFLDSHLDAWMELPDSTGASMNGKGSPSCCVELRSQYVLLQQHRYSMCCLAPAFFFTGFELAFVTGEFPKIVSSDGRTLALIFIFWGIAEVLGSMIIGSLSDCIGSRITVCMGSVAYAGALFIAAMLNVDGAAYDGAWHGVSWLAYLAAFLFGFADCAFNTQVYALLSTTFPEDGSIGGFTLFQLLQNFGSALMYFLPVVLSGGLGGDQCAGTAQPGGVKIGLIYTQAAVLLVTTLGVLMFKADKEHTDELL